MEITKEQIDEALKESLIHWNLNVENFPTDPDACIGDWVDANCTGYECALCQLLSDPDGNYLRCELCPLNDDSGVCCSEWRTAAYIKTSLETITAVRDRIEAECKKRGLL